MLNAQYFGSIYNWQIFPGKNLIIKPIKMLYLDFVVINMKI